MKYEDDVCRCITAPKGQDIQWLAFPKNIFDRRLYLRGRWDSL